MDVAFCWVVDVVRLRTEEDGTIKRSNMITSTLFLSSNNTLSETKNIYSSKKTFIISLLSFFLKLCCCTIALISSLKYISKLSPKTVLLLGGN